MNTLSKVHEKCEESQIFDESKVDLNSLSKLTGFPTEFIRKELFLKEDVSMEDLRSSMMTYLNSTFHI